MPTPFESFTTLLGGAASPVALVCIGLFLAQERVVSHDAVSIGILVAMKLILQPAVTALLAFYVFSMPPLWSHLGRDPERASDRVGTIHHRQALWTGGRRDLGLDSGFAYFCRPDRLTARRVARTDSLELKV